MANDDILSQEEIDALIHGVEQGQVDTKDEYRLHDNVAREVDLTAHERIVRGVHAQLYRQAPQDTQR